MGPEPPPHGDWGKQADYWEDLSRDSEPDVAAQCAAYAKYLRAMAQTVDAPEKHIVFMGLHKRDWAIVTICLAATIFFGIYSVKLAIEYRTELASEQHQAAGCHPHCPTDISSSRK
jgi:hypothetical protein